MRISDWSSDVCSSDLIGPDPLFSRFPVRNFRSDLSIAGESSLTLPALIAAMRDLPRDADAIAARRARLTEASARLRRQQREQAARSEERRVGKECGRTFKSRWAP